MSHRKIIIITVLATTAFWAAALAVFIWAVTRTNPGEGPQITSAMGYQAVFWVSNTSSNTTVLTFDYMGTNMSGPNTTRTLLFEREVEPMTQIGIGMRKRVQNQ